MAVAGFQNAVPHQVPITGSSPNQATAVSNYNTASAAAYAAAIAVTNYSPNSAAFQPIQAVYDGVNWNIIGALIYYVQNVS